MTHLGDTFILFVLALKFINGELIWTEFIRSGSSVFAYIPKPRISNGNSHKGTTFGSIDKEKAQLRQKMIDILKHMSEDTRKFESDITVLKVLTLTSVRAKERIAVYLNTELEVRTEKLVKNILQKGKECFVPRRNGTEIEMVKLRSIEDYESLEVNDIGFKEPNLKETRENALEKGGVDIMIVPGLAFTKRGDRLGRGRGMYDRYVTSIRAKHNVTVIGLAYEAQMLKSIPTDDDDIEVDMVMHMKYFDKTF